MRCQHPQYRQSTERACQHMAYLRGGLRRIEAQISRLLHSLDSALGRVHQ